jgi:hypothetical protein
MAAIGVPSGGAGARLAWYDCIVPIISTFFGITATARKLIKQWARLHREELESNWLRAQKLQPLENIPPLE